MLHTRWHRSGNADYRRLTRFFGGLMLISIAVGVVTGLVQEFQFGMDWSAYSRFVGDVFGAPLAMEGLAAFFLESTFLGLWVFGWNVLPRGVHLATAWLVAVGACLSAAFIIAANSWMQNPVGYTINPDTGRPQLTLGRGAVHEPDLRLGLRCTSSLTSLVYGSAVLLAVSAWHLRRNSEVTLFHRTAKLGVWVMLVAVLLQFRIGGQLGQIETELPADEGRRDGGELGDLPAVLVLLGPDGAATTPTSRQRRSSRFPHLLSLLATGTWDGQVLGMNEVNAQYQQQFPQNGQIPTFPTSSSSTGRCG